MQVVLLCGGLGTRLREETVFIPKPMVQIGERPIVWHIMKYFERSGFSDFILALGYKGDSIRQYFLDYENMHCDLTVDLSAKSSIQVHGNHDEHSWKVTLVDTGAHTLKGGRLKRVERHIVGDCFFVSYGDGLSDVDLDRLLAFHRSHGRIATVTGVNPLARFGELKTDGDRVTAFAEKPEINDDFINGGFFVFDRRIFDYLAADDDCDLEIGALEILAGDGQLMIHRHQGFWSCMDTQRDREYLNKIWQSGNVPWKNW